MNFHLEHRHDVDTTLFGGVTIPIRQLIEVDEQIRRGAVMTFDHGVEGAKRLQDILPEHQKLACLQAQ